MKIENFDIYEKLDGVNDIYCTLVEDNKTMDMHGYGNYTTLEEAKEEAIKQLYLEQHNRKYPYAGVKSSKSIMAAIDKFTWDNKKEEYLSNCETTSQFIWSMNLDDLEKQEK